MFLKLPLNGSWALGKSLRENPSGPKRGQNDHKSAFAGPGACSAKFSSYFDRYEHCKPSGRRAWKEGLEGGLGPLLGLSFAILMPKRTISGCMSGTVQLGRLRDAKNGRHSVPPASHGATRGDHWSHFFVVQLSLVTLFRWLGLAWAQFTCQNSAPGGMET